MGAQGKQEGDGGQARADGREDERLGQAADNGVAGAVEAGGSAEEVLVTVQGGEESVGVPWERTDRAPTQVEKAAREGEDSLAERRRRAAVRGAHSPVSPSGGHAVDVPLEVADVVPDGCGNLQRRARSEPGQGRSRRPGKAWGETHRDNDQERHRGEEQEGSESNSEQNTPSETTNEEFEEQQSLEQWLRRIEDDPGELLRRKFRYQYRQRQLNGTANSLQNGGQIW